MGSEDLFCKDILLMLHLSPLQSRVIGVMLEKESTTPDQYPLSLNSLTTGCNQKSNREPVMSLTEHEIQEVVDELVKAGLILLEHQSSSRVAKYIHRFCNTEFGDLKFTAQQRALICVLLLRGPQTPGELRTRTNRLAEFCDVNEVEQTLAQLQNYHGQVLVQKLPREPGKRESRYIHLFTPLEEHALTESVSAETSELAESQSMQGRVDALERQVASLTQQLVDLSKLLNKE